MLEAAARVFHRLYDDDPIGPTLARFMSWYDNDANACQRAVATMLAARDQWVDTVAAVAREPELTTRHHANGVGRASTVVNRYRAGPRRSIGGKRLGRPGRR